MVSILIVIYIVFVSLGLPDSLFGVAWPVVHKDFMLPESFASLYSIVTGVCSGGVSFIAGYVIRKFGTPKVTLYSTLLTAVGLVGISFSPNIWVMMGFTIVMSYGAGAIDTALNNFVALHYEARHMSWLHCFWGLGVTISPLIMAQFLGSGEGSWRSGYKIVALLQLSVAVIILLHLKKWKKTDEKTNSGEELENNSTQKVNIFKIKGALTSILSQGFYCSMEFLIGTWGATYLVNVFSSEPSVAARWVSLYYGGIMLGRLVSGFISFKASDNTLIRGGIAVSFVGITLLLLPLGEISIFGLLLIGFGFGPVFPSILHSVPARFGEEHSADLTGFHMGGAYAIGFFVQLVFGYTAAATTFKITPVVLVAFCILLFIMNELTIKKTEKREQI